MRRRLPMRRTLPSSTVDTCSFHPTSPRSSFFPLRANETVLDATCNDWIFDNALMISSAIPSAKYSLSGSLLMFANGNTATDFAADTLGCGNVAVSVGVVAELDARACANNAEVL